MSIKIMSHVWDNSKLKGNALLLMLAIADHTDDNGIAYPSRKRLARKVRVTPQTVDKLIDECQRAGELLVFSRRIGNMNFTNHYVIAGFCDLSELQKERDLGDLQPIPVEPKETEKLSEKMLPPSKGDLTTSKGDYTTPSKGDLTTLVNAPLPESSFNLTFNHHSNASVSSDTIDTLSQTSSHDINHSEDKSVSDSSLLASKTPLTSKKSIRTRKQRTERPRNPVWDKIAELFFNVPIGDTPSKQTSGRVAMLNGIASKLISSSEEVVLFVAWYKRKMPNMSLPTSGATFEKYLREYVAIVNKNKLQTPTQSEPSIWDL